MATTPERPSTLTVNVTADDLDEAVQFAVDQAIDFAEANEMGEFTSPELVREYFIKLDGGWKRGFELSFDFRPAAD
ncbi:MAG: hypothetical protein ABWY57_15955 [Mycetocola sp.]